MAKIPQKYWAIINSALADNAACLVGTATKAGEPQISPKGSVLVLDESTLAYWERSGRSAQKNVGENPHVVVYFRNPARADALPRGAAIRFHGVATVHATGPVRDKVWDMTVPFERERDPEKKGVAVVIALGKVEDLSGAPVVD